MAKVGRPGLPQEERRRAWELWRRSTRVVAAHRDGYTITTDNALGAPPEATTQKIDCARAEAALRVIAKLSGPRRNGTPM